MLHLWYDNIFHFIFYFKCWMVLTNINFTNFSISWSNRFIYQSNKYFYIYELQIKSDKISRFETDPKKVIELILESPKDPIDYKNFCQWGFDYCSSLEQESESLEKHGKIVFCTSTSSSFSACGRGYIYFYIHVYKYVYIYVYI